MTLTMYSQKSKDANRDLCREFGISIEEGFDIIRSQFKLLESEIEKYDFETMNYPTIGIIKWGKFIVKDSRRKK